MLLTILFILFMFGTVGKLIWWAIKATWGITKVIFYIFFMPIILIVMACCGLLYVAFPILCIIGLITILVPKKRGL